MPKIANRIQIRDIPYFLEHCVKAPAFKFRQKTARARSTRRRNLATLNPPICCYATAVS